MDENEAISWTVDKADFIAILEAAVFFKEINYKGLKCYRELQL